MLTCTMHTSVCTCNYMHEQQIRGHEKFPNSLHLINEKIRGL